LQQAGRQAADPVANVARNAIPHESGTLAGDVRVSSARSGASVRVGRASIPYAGPVDFGGWPGEREYVAAGRYLFPAAQGLASSTATLYGQALDRALADVSWTNTASEPEAVHD
jgi:hypothetical protein